MWKSSFCRISPWISWGKRNALTTPRPIRVKSITTRESGHRKECFILKNHKKAVIGEKGTSVSPGKSTKKPLSAKIA
jgi:hypothetical protein